MNDLTIHVQKGEPRVLDTDLAERLGLGQPTDIRSKIIKAHKAELETYGPLRQVGVKTSGRPGKAFYFNEEQALLVVMFSRTDRATQMRPGRLQDGR